MKNSSINNIFVEGSNVYLATGNGLAISTDGGNSFTLATKEKNGLENNDISHVFADGKTIYAVENSESISVSKDGGKTFQKKKIENYGSGITGIYNVEKDVYVRTGTPMIYASKDQGGSFGMVYGGDLCRFYYPLPNSTTVVSISPNNDELLISTDNGNVGTFQKSSCPSKTISYLLVDGSIIYATSSEGLYISTDKGKTFTLKTTAEGLVDNTIKCLSVNGNNIYIGTSKGLSVSSDGGKTFTNYTKENSGLEDNNITSLSAYGTAVYIASKDGITGTFKSNIPKPVLPKPSETYQMEFKHSNKVVQIDAGEAIETGIAEGFGASIGIGDGAEMEGGFEGEVEGGFEEGDFVVDAVLLQKTAEKTNKNQHWAFKDAGNGFYHILSSSNSEALELKGEGDEIFPSTGKSSSSATQLWKLEDAGSGYFRLFNKAANKYLEVPENDQTEDAMLHYGPKSGDNQLVKFVKVQ